MNDWILLLVASTVGSVVSLSGGIYLLYGKKGSRHVQKYAVPFAAGALLAAAFLDLLPEAFSHGDARSVSIAILSAFLFFFLLERGLSWFHHHHEHEDEKRHKNRHRTSALIIIGDTLHNFIDGLAIGAAFLVNPAMGIATTLAVAAHEIPQEIGDFGLLLARGMKKKRIILVNLLSALVTVIGAALVYGFGGHLEVPEAILLGIIAGFFIYIAASDIVPTIHNESDRRNANIQSVVLLFGVVFVGVVTTIAHGYIAHPDHDGHSHEHKTIHSHEEESHKIHGSGDDNHDHNHSHDH
ncbi:ZIP family metal transporter [Candidatus Saccharibacteria bacterium]|nr:ZIP family metal transporter [Candidatus Saccharibacteria bacterium]